MVRGLQALKDATVITYIRLRAEQRWFDSPQKQIFLCRCAQTKPESATLTLDNCYVRTSQKGIPFYPFFHHKPEWAPAQSNNNNHSIQSSLLTRRINSPRANYRDSTIYVKYTQSTRRGADRSGRAVQGAGPRLFACLDFGYESRRGHGCLSLVSAMCCRVEVSASSSSRVQRSPTECVCI
jgi:hypothetical protein